MKALLSRILNPMGLEVINSNDLKSLRENAIFESHSKYKYLTVSAPSHLPAILNLSSLSSAQLCQDLFVIEQLKFKREGFFIEFGATNGKNLSNTWLLETEFAWKGILAEPARSWHKELRSNRPNATIDFRCVWTESGLKLSFTEVESGELSTITEFVDRDMHMVARKNHVKYEVETITLRDLLIQNNAPKVIDYLSIDTEGSEFAILSGFDFNEYQIEVITCEHNYGPQREDIYKLLTGFGYKRVNEDISLFDDWYVKSI